MSKKTKFDLIVIGAGSSGLAAVQAARASGASVCLIEKAKLGGECPNSACVPSKALLKTANVYRQASQAKLFGTELGKLGFDFVSIMRYRQSVIDAVTGAGGSERYLRLLQKMQVTLVQGAATFIDDHTVEVLGQHYFGSCFVIATGTVDFVPSIRGIDEIPLLSWKEALSTTRQPKSIATIGGGPVAVEIATFYSTFGTRVVILEPGKSILAREDVEIAALAQESLRALGVEIITNANILELIHGRGGVFGLHVESDGEPITIAVERIMLAAGKRSNIEGLGLEEIGVSLTDHAEIKTSSDLATSIRHIFAAGDVNGGMLFTHVAHYEGHVAGWNAAQLSKNKRTREKIDERVVPRVTFLCPEVASVGMTQEEARKKFGKVLVGRANIGILGRAVADHSRVGLVKLVCHPKTRKLLGAHIIAARAGEMVHEAALAIHLNATVDKVASMIHAYPTYSEGLKVAASSMKIE